MPDTTGTLTFFESRSWPKHQRPYELLFQPPDDDFPVCNYTVTQIPDVPIHDLRPLKNKLSLDREGFLVTDLDTKMTYDEYFDQETLKRIYVAEIKAILKDMLGVRAAYIHECVVGSLKIDLILDRSANMIRSVHLVGMEATLEASVSPSPMFILVRSPLFSLMFAKYLDYTHDYALELLEELTGDKTQAETIKKSRVQMLNVWKPLRGPLRSWPLALCDLQSLNRDDLVTFDEVHATAVLNSQQVIYNPSQKWYYLSNQEPTELIIFKSMDSVTRGEVAHASFFDPTCPANEPPRESIELRVLVVY